MRISDWSSDVCSSDLRSHRVGPCSEQRREARTMVESRWAARLGKWALWLALTGLALAAVGVVLARYDVVEKLSGFMAMLIGGALSLVALAAGLASLLLALRHTTPGSRKELGSGHD